MIIMSFVIVIILTLIVIMIISLAPEVIKLVTAPSAMKVPRKVIPTTLKFM
jgi:hypothetical protein